MLLSFLKSRAATLRRHLQLPAAAKAERDRDRKKISIRPDPGCQPVIDAGLDWLIRAQQLSKSNDGGVARDFSLLTGWATSYPETTGYIIPTFLDLAQSRKLPELRDHAVRMLDWLAGIQFPDGGFQGGKIDAPVKVPVTFNTGQILLGLASGAKHLGRYHDEMHKAANWLVESQDEDGCWRAHPTPFAQPGEKTYETHVAWGLLEAFKVSQEKRYLDAAVRNNYWAITQQQENGWFENCCLSDPQAPLTHTIGYAVRGITEAYLTSGDTTFRDAAVSTANAIVQVTREDGFLAGTWTRDWKPASDWMCLTGAVQLAHSLLLLHHDAANGDYLETARRLNAFVRRTINLGDNLDTRGAVKGSFPVDGQYGTYEYLNWAAKFCIDSNVLEASLAVE